MKKDATFSFRGGVFEALLSPANPLPPAPAPPPPATADLPPLTSPAPLPPPLTRPSIQAHVACLTDWLHDHLTGLAHSNGQPMMRVFGKHTDRK